MKLTITVLLFLWGCGASDNKPNNSSNLPANWNVFQAKREQYGTMARAAQQEFGFIESSHCDSLLFTSLGAAGGLLVSIEAAQGEPGQWFRRPAKDCYDTGKSKSDISKDMFMGLAWHLFYSSRADLAEGVLRYGRANGYIMGRGPASRTFMTPSLQAVYAELLQYLGGPTFDPEIRFPQVYPPGERGYTAHLQVLNILLRAHTTGGISDAAKARLSDHRARNPGNGLYCYGDNLFNSTDMAECIDTLLRDDLFPSARLPESGDRCEEWLWQREESTWEPCPEEGRIHSGADFLFVAKLIAGFYGEP